jgi:hypothetical protein
MATTPFMLNVLMLAYEGASAKEIISSDPVQSRQEQIFSTYVERMLNRRQKDLRLGTHEQFKHWLASLASGMQRHNQTIFLVESLQPDWLPRRLKILYDGCCVLLVLLFFVVLIELARMRASGSLVKRG